MRLVLARDHGHAKDWGVWDLFTKEYPLKIRTRSDGCLFGKKEEVWRSFLRLVRGELVQTVSNTHNSVSGQDET